MDDHPHGFLGIVALAGFYDALREAGPVMILAPILGAVGLTLVTVSHLIPVAIGVRAGARLHEPRARCRGGSAGSASSSGSSPDGSDGSAPASYVIERISSLGFIGFFVFMLSMGVALIRRRTKVDAPSPASTH